MERGEILTVNRRRVAAAFIAVALLLGLVPVVAAGQPTLRAADAAAPSGRLIVLWRTTQPSRIGIAGITRVERAESTQRSVVIARNGQTAAVAAALRKDPRVLGVVPDAVVKATAWPADGPPSDPLFDQQDDLTQIHVPEVWPTTTGDPGVVIAVIDTGVDVTHPDLAGVTVVDPRNEIWNSTDTADDNGHGTHVAGTIFARDDNGLGISGIAPASTLMPIKVLDGNGSGFVSDVLDAVDWARTHGADIMNLSLGGSLTHDQIAMAQPTFTAARAAGILVVAAAGNDGSQFMSYPAGLQGVVSVGAVDDHDVAADFSTHNRGVDISAPGVDTLSTIDGAYDRLSGTSMATPHVVGVAALIWAARPSLSVAELEAVLRTSSVDLGDPGRDDYYGSGRIDAAAALTAAVPDPLPDLEPAPGPVGAFEATFTSPSAPVTQTSTSFAVSWTATHEVVDGYMVRLTWHLDHGVCPDPLDVTYDDFQILGLDSPMVDTGLEVGACHRYELLVVDADGEVVDITSDSVSVVDHTRPTVVSHTPNSAATGVSRTSSVKIVFSESVKGVSSKTLRLKNLSSGLWVKAKVTYSGSTRTAVINPMNSMFRGGHYAVYIESGISDISGNTLTARHWTFRTKH
jgi:subtilisin family serine protease